MQSLILRRLITEWIGWDYTIPNNTWHGEGQLFEGNGLFYEAVRDCVSEWSGREENFGDVVGACKTAVDFLYMHELLCEKN